VQRPELAPIRCSAKSITSRTDPGLLRSIRVNLPDRATQPGEPLSRQ
jgi:hypothetical protein